MKCFAFCIASVLAASTLAQSLDNTFDVALGTAGLNTQTARFDQQVLSFFQSRSFSTQLYDSAYSQPWRAPVLFGLQRDQIAQPNDRPADLLAVGSRMLGIGVRRSLLGNPIEAAERFAARPGSLNAALERMRRENLISGAIPPTNGVPEPARQAAALLLTVILDSAPVRRAAFSGLGSTESLFLRTRAPEPATYDAERVSRMLRDQRSVDMNFLYAASQDIATAAVVARNRLLGIDRTEKFSWRVNTAWGEIILSGGTDDRYDGGAALLILDAGGDDTYVGYPSNRSVANWTSLVLDARGNDKYVSDAGLLNRPVRQDPQRKNATGFGPASANLGISMLFDLQGDDLYRTTSPGLASASFGVAVLSDGDGNDRYDAYANAQAYATFGLALLEDLNGDDQYDGFSAVQGHGGPMGFAALVDRRGNDKYFANNVDLDFPSPQTAQANVSMAQGAGVGRRADFLEGHSQSGGVGVLYDLDGNDEYSAGVFAQGVGYWEGVGMLFDRAGNDRYSGVWYVQGSTAHFGIGFLEDEAGKDEYIATQNMAMGAGHDFGIGMLLDRGGDDTYKGPNLSLGASSANGIGVLMDFDGADNYSGVNLTLGRSAEVPRNSLREKGLGVGLFYDGGGMDTYPTATNWARNAARLVNWTDRNERPQESQFGIFWDR